MSDLVTEFWPVQPEPGSVADQLIKKGEARGMTLGEARGEKRASIKKLIKPGMDSRQVFVCCERVLQFDKSWFPEIQRTDFM